MNLEGYRKCRGEGCEIATKHGSGLCPFCRHKEGDEMPKVNCKGCGKPAGKGQKERGGLCERCYNTPAAVECKACADGPCVPEEGHGPEALEECRKAREAEESEPEEAGEETESAPDEAAEAAEVGERVPDDGWDRVCRIETEVLVPHVPDALDTPHGGTVYLSVLPEASVREIAARWVDKFLHNAGVAG